MEGDTPQDALARVVTQMLERDFDPAGVPPYFRVTGVEVGYEGGNRRMTVKIQGTTSRYTT